MSGPHRFVIVVAALAAAQPVAAQQSIWLDQPRDNLAWVEIQRPAFDREGWGGRLSSYLLHAGARLRLTRGLALVVDVPVGRAASSETVFWGSDRSDTRVGNPYLGLRAASRPSRVSGEIGVLLPIVKEKPADGNLVHQSNVIGDFDRTEAFATDMVVLRGQVSMEQRNPQGLFLRVRLGPTLWIPSGDNGYPEETEVILDYGAGAGVERGLASVQVGFTGRWIVTEEDANFGEASIHQLGLAVSYQFGTVRPTLFFRVPVDDDLKEALNSVVGVGVTVALP